MHQSVTLNPISNFSAHRPHQAREAADTSSYIDPKYRFIEERERQTWEVKTEPCARAACISCLLRNYCCKSSRQNRNTSILAEEITLTSVAGSGTIRSETRDERLIITAVFFFSFFSHFFFPCFSLHSSYHPLDSNWCNMCNLHIIFLIYCTLIFFLILQAKRYKRELNFK